MIHFLRLVYSLLLFFVFGYVSMLGQTRAILLSDKDLEATEAPSTPLVNRKMQGPDTLSISVGQDFFDDFSGGNTVPNPSLWFNPEFEARTIPLINNNSAIGNPSRGTVDFDGSDDAGQPYDTKSLSLGKADLLLSHYIDLSPYTASNNIYLSFYLQAGGRSEPPESTDTFFVSFLTPTDTFQVYSQAGGGSPEFKLISIPVNQFGYFVTEFQIAFENKGSLNGPQDVWHLDYVLLGLNRGSGTLGINDQAVVGLVRPPLDPYTAIPLKHLPSMNGRMQEFEVSVSNLATSSQPMSLESELKESFLSTPLNPPFIQSQSLSLSGSFNGTATFSPFANQSLTSISVLELEVLANTYDTYQMNNSFSERFPIDSVMAYDDGEADMSFGLNRPFGFGVQVDLEREDSISAVWIRFMPTVNFNPISNAIDYMDDRSFRFRIWNQPHPDSILFEQVNDMKVNYGTAPNSFIRYPLNRNVPVNGTIWVGIQQLNTLPIGVGYDMTYENNNLCYYDSSGVWTPINLGGTLMIRPEFYNTTEVVLSTEEDLRTRLQVYPNPVHSRNLHIEIDPGLNVRNYEGRLLDAKGSQVFSTSKMHRFSNKLSIDLPPQVQQGLYIWQHILTMSNGEQEIISKKLLINISN